MKAILTINHSDIILPDEKHLGTLLKILSGARIVRDYSYRIEDGFLKIGPEVKIEAKLITESIQVKFVDENDQEIPASTVRPAFGKPVKALRQTLRLPDQSVPSA